MNIRPQDLPELRVELLVHYNNPFVIDWWAQAGSRGRPPAMTVLGDDGSPIAVLDPSGDKRRLNEIDRLTDAELYFVSEAMTGLAVAAAKSMPPFQVAPEDLPSPNGLVIFEKPIAIDRNTRGGHGEEMHIQGASWNLHVVPKWGPILWFSFYVDLHPTLDAEAKAGVITVAEAARQKGFQPRYSYTMDAAYRIGATVVEDSVLHSWGRVILAAWLLMSQTLADVSQAEAPRAVARRLRRAGHEPATVRVIELRRPKSGGGSGESDREYHHQWIVRGHWRQQWHPKRQVHRPVWIAPHIKGPEGAPLIGGEKVYALKR